TPPAVSYHVPVLPSGDDGDTTTRDDADAAAAQPTPSWYPLEKLDTPDWRLVGKNFELPEWCATDQRWPSGWVGTLLAGTASAGRSPQEEIRLPGFYGLVAPSSGSAPLLGTPVYSVGQDSKPETYARLQTILDVQAIRA